MKKKLFKSKTDKMICGICGGFAEYLDIDASIVRLAWIALLPLGGASILAYIVAAFILPLKEE